MIETKEEIHPIFDNCPKNLEFKKLRKRIIRLIKETIHNFKMIEKQAKWLVCISGGKESFTLLAALIELKWRGLLPVEMLVCNLDQGQPNFPKTILPKFLKKLGIPHRIEYQNTYSIVKNKIQINKTYCSLCSRLRRGHLYRIAREEKCTAVILGIHQVDILETFSNYMKFPIIPCDLCGSQDGLERKKIKEMLKQWEFDFPGRKQVMYKALSNSNPSHLLDRSLFNFSNLYRNRL